MRHPKALVADIKNNADNVVDAVLDCKLVEKSTIYGFQGNKKKDFIRFLIYNILRHDIGVYSSSWSRHALYQDHSGSA